MLVLYFIYNIILLAKITDAQNEIVLGYHRVRELDFLAVVFAATLLASRYLHIKTRYMRNKYEINVFINYISFQVKC